MERHKLSSCGSNVSRNRPVLFLIDFVRYKYDHRTKDGVEIYAHSWMQIHEWVESDTRLKSKFEIDPATQMDRGDYECLADNKVSLNPTSLKANYAYD